MPQHSEKLDAKAFHLPYLAQQGAGPDGWAPVSTVIWPLLGIVPADLLEREWLEGAEKGRCQLIPAGAAVLKCGSPRR
jgi:hypothetical protein